MKKPFLLTLTILLLLASVSFAGEHKKKVKSNAKNIKRAISRQCCTVTAAWNEDGGSSNTVTACAGWFLSNDQNAYERACEKARQALNAVH